LPRFPALPPGYDAWSLGAGGVVVRRDVADAVRAALTTHPSLYAWAAAQPGRTAFTGRGEAYGVTLGAVGAVVRHARRGGFLGPLLGDRYLGVPRLYRELAWSRRLADAGIPTPAFLAGVWRRSGAVHRADVATARLAGSDLVALVFGSAPPAGEARAAILRAVGRLVRRLHAAGFVHPDLQLRNVLVAGAPPEAWLLDVDSCREAAGTGDRRRNLRRFYRSWEKWNRLRGPLLTAADRAAFEAGYGEAA
jgi:tRNA A-37 threonylcarbamoyl transferase component Bud32